MNRPAKQLATKLALSMLLAVGGCSISKHIAPIGDVNVNPKAVGFPAVKVGNSSPARVVTLGNPASNKNAAIIESFSTSDSQFSVDDSTTTCTRGTLPAGTACKIGLTFTPSSEGVQTATLTISDNAVNSPQTITLKGTGKK